MEGLVKSMLIQAAMRMQDLDEGMKRVIQYIKETTGTTQPDPRLMRARLMISELGECVGAMAKRDEVEVLDGLADLIYVTFGTADVFDLPLARAFDDVHASNMSKGVVKHELGINGKGEGYFPPRLKEILYQHRVEKGLNQ